VWLVLGSPSGLGAATRVLSGHGDQEHFGFSLAGAGDVNGDGFDDVLVGGTGPTGGRGIIQLYAGTSDGLAGLPLWSRKGAPNAGWGRVVGAGGDVNGDGFADIVTSANQFGGFCGNQDLFLGTPNGLMNLPIVTTTPGIKTFGTSRDFDHDGVPESLYISKCATGLSVRDFPEGTVEGLQIYTPVGLTAGDFDGDGHVDIAAGEPTFQYQTFYGRVSVFTIQSQFLPTGRVPLYDGPQPGARWGEALAAIDVDGDGADELIVGAPSYDANFVDEGIVTFFPGRKPTIDLVETSDSPRAPGTVADFDGDGFSDLAGTTIANVQDAQVFYGSPAGLPEVAGTTLVMPAAPQPREFRAVSFTAGDADGDGYDDLLLTSYTYDVGHGVEFGERVNAWYRGSASGLSPTYASLLAFAPYFVGDVTGDGFDDALAGNTVYLGSSTGLVQGQTLAGSAIFSAIPGDFDDDGVLDFLLNRPSNSVTVYHGSASGLVFGDSWWDSFPNGTSPQLIDVLDVNGDGLDDLLFYFQGDFNKCRVYVRTAAGFARAPQWFESPIPSGSSSSTDNPQILGSFDADQDGFEDLLLSSSGQCSLHTGSATGLSRAPAWVGQVNMPGAFPPFTTLQTADFDGDGAIEAFISSPFFGSSIHEAIPR
jgi:hypothetical protein